MSWLGLDIDWTAGWAAWASTAGSEPEPEPTVVGIGWRYRCGRCDVIGYSAPDAACWCCDQTDQLTKAA